MRKRFAGIDIGSRSIELVVVDDSGKIVTSLQTDTGFDPMTAAKDLIHGVAYDCIMATGYGRNLFEISFDTLTVTEIKAHAIGARAFFPNVQAVLDIGGQDSKAIPLPLCGARNTPRAAESMSDFAVNACTNLIYCWALSWAIQSFLRFLTTYPIRDTFIKTQMEINHGQNILNQSSN